MFVAANMKLAGESISRILCAAQRAEISSRANAAWRSFLWACDCSRGSMQPTRGFTCIGPGQPYPPIWPCSTRGFPCLRCRHRSGGLLPHRFTLACASLELACERFCLSPAAERIPHWRFRFCGTVRSRILANPAPWRYQARRPIRFENGGVRTFLQRADPAASAPAITRSARCAHYT